MQSLIGIRWLGGWGRGIGVETRKRLWV